VRETFGHYLCFASVGLVRADLRLRERLPGSSASERGLCSSCRWSGQAHFWRSVLIVALSGGGVSGGQRAPRYLVWPARGRARALGCAAGAAYMCGIDSPDLRGRSWRLERRAEMVARRGSIRLNGGRIDVPPDRIAARDFILGSQLSPGTKLPSRARPGRAGRCSVVTTHRAYGPGGSGGFISPAWAWAQSWPFPEKQEGRSCRGAGRRQASGRRSRQVAGPVAPRRKSCAGSSGQLWSQVRSREGANEHNQWASRDLLEAMTEKSCGASSSDRPSPLRTGLRGGGGRAGQLGQERPLPHADEPLAAELRRAHGPRRPLPEDEVRLNAGLATPRGRRRSRRDELTRARNSSRWYPTWENGRADLLRRFRDPPRKRGSTSSPGDGGVSSSRSPSPGARAPAPPTDGVDPSRGG